MSDSSSTGESSSTAESSSIDLYLSDSSDSDSSVSERQSPSKRLKASDRVSALPDPILHQILCYGDMKEVVRTSKLSRRWSNDDLDNWITAAERRSVKQLCLDLKSINGIRVLPPFIFNSNVKMFKLQCETSHVKLPNSICFAPNLHAIELFLAKLPDSNSTKEVEIRCPVLEELKLSKCNHHKIETLHISAPLLKNLVLEDPHFHLRPCCKLKLSTPNLTSLVLKGRMYTSYSLGTLPSLVNAKFESKDECVGARILHEVLNALCSVRNLQVSNLSLKPCAESPAKLYRLLDPFLNLRHLQLIGFSDGFSDGSCVRLIYNLLTNTRSLENLALGMNQIRMDKDWVDLFHCVSSLKSLEINGIEGREVELDFFKFVFKTAVSLEVFNLIPNERFLVKSKKEKANFTMKMYSLPRASSMVKVFFFQ